MYGGIMHNIWTPTISAEIILYKKRNRKWALKDRYAIEASDAGYTELVQGPYPPIYFTMRNHLRVRKI